MRLLLVRNILVWMIAFWMLVVYATGFPAVARGQSPEESPAAIQQGDGTIFLPVITNGAATTDLFPLAPGAVTEPLPDPDSDQPAPVHPQAGICLAGNHPLHISGFPNLVAGDDTEDGEGASFSDQEYICQPDQTLDDAQCSLHGKPLLLGGLAACQCETGYAGATCALCAPGYALDSTSQTCEVVESKPKLTIDGVKQSIETGSTALFTATDGRGEPVAATWTLQSDIEAASTIDLALTGCLFDPANEQECRQSFTGTRVGYRAPERLEEPQLVKTVELDIDPLNRPDFDLSSATIVIIGAGTIPISGYGDAAMQPFLDAMSRYMRQRCIGAATLGVARYGEPLAVYGLGREDGRAAASWHDYCGDDESPPLANPVTDETPFRVGSTNKPVTFATLRYVVKEQMQLHDTDLALTMLDEERVVTAQRTANGAIKLVVWEIDTAGDVTQQGEAVVELGDVEGIPMQARDLQLITLANGVVVLGVRNSSNQLQLDGWTVTVKGALQPQAHTLFAESDLVDLQMTALEQPGLSNRFVLAQRNSHGALTLQVYSISGGGFVDGEQQFPEARARDLALVDVSDASASRVVVGTRDGDGTLGLTTYNIAVDGAITALASAGAGTVQALALTRIGPNRILSAVRDSESALKLITWSVSNTGQIKRLHDVIGATVLNLSLTSLSDARVVVTAQLASTGILQLSSWHIANDGSVSHLDDDKAGEISGVAVQMLDTQRVLVTVRTQSATLKNIVWDLDLGGVFTRQGELEGEAMPDSLWSDADIESLRLAGFDLPDLLLPERVHALFRGDMELPVILPSIIQTDDEGNETVLCEALTQYAEPEWQQTTLGHLMRHATGLPKSAPDLYEQVHNLHLLRGLTSEADFIAEEAKLRTAFADNVIDNAGAVDSGKALLDYDSGETVYVVPEPNLEEIMVLLAGRCLPNELGTPVYSNTNPAIAALVIQHFMGYFAAEQGYPATHEGSALDRFFAERVGVETTSSTGIYNSHRIPVLAGYTPRDPTLREWGSSGYYGELYDEKRPHCVWNGSSCSFDDWSHCAWNGESCIASDWPGPSHGRLQWRWENVERLPFRFAAVSPGQGASGNLSVEPATYLAFMRDYWVNSNSDDPSIGEARNGVWNSFRTHNGSGAGTKARIIQFGTLGSVASTSDDFFQLAAELPRKYGLPYFPIITEDVFGTPQSAYFVANGATGIIHTYQPDGSPADQTNAFFASGDSFAVGHNGFQQVPDSFYVAHPSTGLLNIINPHLKVSAAYNINFEPGDVLVVDDLLQTDVYDEIIVGDVSSGEVHVYPSWPQGSNNLLVPISPVFSTDLNFAPDDKLAVDDVTGNVSNELFIARAATGQVEIYRIQGGTLENTPWKTLAAGYSSDDGFVVSNVVGDQTARDEIIVGRADSHDIDVYYYNNNQYELYTSFNGLYTAGGALTANDPWEGSKLNEIVVGVTGYNVAIVFKAEKNDDGLFQFFLADFQALEGDFASGDGVAAGFWAGRHRFLCAHGPTGIRQTDFPDGVDVFVSLNTSSDKQCVEAGDCGTYIAEMRDRVIKYALCQVNWAEVMPTP